MYKQTDYTDPAFSEYRDKILALGPINTNEKARQYWELFRTYYPPKPDKVHREERAQIDEIMNKPL